MKFISKAMKVLSVFAGICGSFFVIMTFNSYGYPAVGWIAAAGIGITALLIYSYCTILENSIICREILQELKEKAAMAENASKEKKENEQISK